MPVDEIPHPFDLRIGAGLVIPRFVPFHGFGEQVVVHRQAYHYAQSALVGAPDPVDVHLLMSDGGKVRPGVEGGIPPMVVVRVTLVRVVLVHHAHHHHADIVAAPVGKVFWTVRTGAIGQTRGHVAIGVASHELAAEPQMARRMGVHVGHAPDSGVPVHVTESTEVAPAKGV
jgi:hypothetical protein